jgi:UDP-glucose 4-epimerase
LDGGESCAVNLGTGEGVSVQEIIHSVEKVANRPVPVRYCPARSGDPASLVANNSKAASLLNWRPIHSEIDYVVQTAWRWHNGHQHGLALAKSDFSSRDSAQR